MFDSRVMALVVVGLLLACGGGSATGPDSGPDTGTGKGPGTGTGTGSDHGASPRLVLEKLGSDPASVIAGDPFPDSIRVVLHDTTGAAKAGATIVFAAIAGGGTLSPSSAVTDAQGRAAAAFTTGPLVGTNTATATVAGADTVSFTTTTVPGPPAAMSLGGPRVLFVDSGSATTSSLSVQDRFGNTIPSLDISYASRDTTAVTVSPTGLVSGRRTGQTMVVAAAGSLSDSVLVVVTAPGTAVLLPNLSRFDLATDTTINVAIVLDMRDTGAQLGSMTGTVVFDPALLSYRGYESGSSGVTPEVNDVDAGAGSVAFSLANANGYAGRVELLTLTFRTVNASGTSGTLAAVPSQIAAAGSFDDLLPHTLVVTYPMVTR